MKKIRGLLVISCILFLSSATLFSQDKGVKEKDDLQFVFSQYDYLTDYYNDLALFRYEGQWGVVKRSGEVLVEPVYDKIQIPMDGHIKVLKNNKIGLLNLKGEVVCEPKYFDIEISGEQIITISFDGKKGCVIEGWNRVPNLYDYFSFNNNILIASKGNQMDLYSKDGLIIENLSNRFSYWDINKDGSFKLEENGLKGINSVNGWLLEPKFKELEKIPYSKYIYINESGDSIEFDYIYAAFIEIDEKTLEELDMGAYYPDYVVENQLCHFYKAGSYDQIFENVTSFKSVNYHLESAEYEVVMNDYNYLLGNDFTVRRDEMLVYGHRIVRGNGKCDLYDKKNNLVLTAKDIYPIRQENESIYGSYWKNVECRFVRVYIENNQFLYNLDKHKVEAKIPSDYWPEYQGGESEFAVICDDTEEENGFYLRYKKNKREKLYDEGTKLTQGKFSKNDYGVVPKGIYFDIFIKNKKFGVLSNEGRVIIEPIYEEIELFNFEEPIILASVNGKTYRIDLESREKVEVITNKQ